MKLTFLGATQTVTGSKYLLDTGLQKILIDCGLFQGYKELRLRNRTPFPVPIKDIDVVILTHAHIDHSGYIPLLVKNGYQKKILCTPATKDLCSILLPDSGYLQEEEARLANKRGFSKHKPALPLYTREDAEKALEYFESVPFEQNYVLNETTSFKFARAGHILGSAFILLRHDHTNIVFSGDLGRPKDPLLYPPDEINYADYLILESTYGNRIHEKENPRDKIGEIINSTVNRGGTIIIPAFSVGRTQNLLFDIYRLMQANRIPNIPVYLDSPLSINATNIFCKHLNEHKLTMNECREIFKVAMYVNTPEQSKEIDTYRKPMIIISASGMAEGGRILHHIKTFGNDPRNTIVFTGYQAGGTRGDRMLRGEKEIKIYGEMVSINAEVRVLYNVSAHADSEEILNWLSNFKRPPKRVFLTHGEKEAIESLKAKITERFGWNCVIPEYLQTEKIK